MYREKHFYPWGACPYGIHRPLSLWDLCLYLAVSTMEQYLLCFLRNRMHTPETSPPPETARPYRSRRWDCHERYLGHSRNWASFGYFPKHKSGSIFCTRIHVSCSPFHSGSSEDCNLNTSVAPSTPSSSMLLLCIYKPPVLGDATAKDVDHTATPWRPYRCGVQPHSPVTRRVLSQFVARSIWFCCNLYSKNVIVVYFCSCFIACCRWFRKLLHTSFSLLKATFYFVAKRLGHIILLQLLSVIVAYTFIKYCNGCSIFDLFWFQLWALDL